MIEAPEECKGIGQSLQNVVNATIRILDKSAAVGALAFSDWEREIATATNHVERAGHKGALQAPGVDAASVRIRNAECPRVGRYPMRP